MLAATTPRTIASAFSPATARGIAVAVPPSVIVMSRRLNRRNSSRRERSEYCTVLIELMKQAGIIRRTSGAVGAPNRTGTIV